MLTCPSAGRVEQDVRRTWRDFWDISGFLQLKCLIILTASKAKSWMVTGTGNMSIVMLVKVVNSGIGHGVVSICLR